MTVEQPDKPKKRPWFQFSLMTAIVVMLAASGLLGLNFHETHGGRGCCGSVGCTVTQDYMRGWPFGFIIRRTQWEILNPSLGGPKDWATCEPPSNASHGNRIEYIVLVFDLMSWIVLLGTAALICEYLVRRHDRRRQQREAKP